MNRVVFMSALLPAVLLTGCVFKSYRPVTEFDLVAGSTEPPARALRVLEFRNDSSSGSRLQWRDSSGRVIRDPYNKWVLPPEQLIARTLNLALRQPDVESAIPIPVAGTIEVFEVDGPELVFRFEGSWTLPGDAREFRFHFAVPVEEESAEAVALAAGEAVRLLAEQLSAWSRSEHEEGK